MEEPTILQQFKKYFEYKIDTSQENLFIDRISILMDRYNSCRGMEFYRPVQEQDTRQELYRTVSKFAKHFSKCICKSDFENKIKKYDTDYTIDVKLRNIISSKVDRQRLKSQSICGLSKYKDLNTRMIIYTDLANAVSSLDTIVTENDTSDGNILGKTLSGIIQNASIVGFDYTKNKDSKLSEFNTYIDITPGFDLDTSHTLGDTEYNYSTSDIFRFANTVNRLKKSISGAYHTLQDKLKTQPDGHGSQSTITGLLYYQSDGSSKDVLSRLHRIATLYSLFEACCNYAYEIDYHTVKKMLHTLEHSYKSEE